MIEVLLVILIVALVGVLVAVIFLAKGRGEAKSKTEDLRLDIAELKGRVDQLVEVHKQSSTRIGSLAQQVESGLNKTIEKSSTSAEKIATQMARVESIGQQIFERSRDLGQPLESFQRLFSSPKLRGGVGEFELEEMLRQFIPTEQYETQFMLDGKMVDAVIKTREGLIPIDSKFPTENYRRMVEPEATDEERARAGRDFERDVRKHVDDIAGKYILPPKTLNFAFIFVPAEAVYATLVDRRGLNQYALDKHVIPVSPNSFFAYLQALAYGFRGMKIEESARQMGQIILAMKREFDRFKGDWRVLGNHLSHAQAKYSEADRDLDRFERTISGLQIGRTAEPVLPVDDAGRLPAEAPAQSPEDAE